MPNAVDRNFEANIALRMREAVIMKHIVCQKCNLNTQPNTVHLTNLIFLNNQHHEWKNLIETAIKKKGISSCKDRYLVTINLVMKKIILSFDGTWNTPDNHADLSAGSDTNVCKLHRCIAPQDVRGNPQIKWYDEGVGSKWYDRFKGGIFGVGLSENIQQGYHFLIDTYEENDEIYLFGFSRGAYTARSLVGLIRNAGLLRKNQEGMSDLIRQAYSIYRSRDKSADETYAKLFRSAHSIDIKIHFIGVWDTVGSLGIPLSSFQWFNREFYQFHDTKLSGIVKNAYHAVAIDEHRKDYIATLWEPSEVPTQKIEQVWFPGAHANVGGGYENNPMSDIALEWMMQKAKQCNLSFCNDYRCETEKCVRAPIVDSFKEFLNGAYSIFSSRFLRPIGFTEFGSESIHPIVKQRSSIDLGYRPKNKINEQLLVQLR